MTTAPGTAAPADPDAARRAAAHLGIRWLILSAERMPEGWVYPFFMRLHRVVGDEQLAGRIEELLRSDADSGKHHPIPPGVGRRRDLEPAKLSPILNELVRRKELGLPHETAVKALQQQISRDEPGFWKPVRATQRAGFLHLFAELGIQTDYTLEDLIDAMRERTGERPRQALAESDRYVYALTHVVLARSRYYRHYVDPSELDFALPILRAALTHRLGSPPSIEALDAIGSVLSSLALMRVPDDALTRRARQRLLDEQNPNGSWGSRRGAGRAKSHATLNGVLATIPYPEQLRVTLAP